MSTNRVMPSALVLMLALQLASTAMADLITSYPGPALDIPDNRLTGLTTTLQVNSSLSRIGDIRVTLDISGRDGQGYNGDLFAFLVHDAQMAVLLNRVGRTASNPDGYADSGGLQITFADVASNDIHSYQDLVGGQGTSPLLGTWSPDGRNLNPFTVTDQDARDAMLSTFLNTDPNGNWSLFIADLSPSGLSRLNGWSLELRSVPEPASGYSWVMAFMALSALARLRRQKI